MKHEDSSTYSDQVAADRAAAEQVAAEQVAAEQVAGQECNAMAAGGMREVEVRGAVGALPAHLYAPSAAAHNDGLIVLFPCGGFMTANLDLADGFARLLVAGTGLHVLACGYTAAGARPFPAAVEDAHAVLEWVVAQRTRLGWSGERLIVAGVEAGGNLAAVSALMARDRGGPALAAQMLIMPMLDPGLTTCSMRTVHGNQAAAHAAGSCAAGYRGYLPRAVDRTHPYASPLRASRMKGLAPALILSAQDDPLRDEAEQYGAKLAAAGIRTVVKRLPPIGFAQPNARCECVQQKLVLQEIAGFLDGLVNVAAIPDANA